MKSVFTILVALAISCESALYPYPPPEPVVPAVVYGVPEVPKEAVPDTEAPVEPNHEHNSQILDEDIRVAPVEFSYEYSIPYVSASSQKVPELPVETVAVHTSPLILPSTHLASSFHVNLPTVVPVQSSYAFAIPDNSLPAPILPPLKESSYIYPLPAPEVHHPAVPVYGVPAAPTAPEVHHPAVPVYGVPAIPPYYVPEEAVHPLAFSYGYSAVHSPLPVLYGSSGLINSVSGSEVTAVSPPLADLPQEQVGVVGIVHSSYNYSVPSVSVKVVQGSGLPVVSSVEKIPESFPAVVGIAEVLPQKPAVISYEYQLPQQVANKVVVQDIPKPIVPHATYGVPNH